MANNNNDKPDIFISYNSRDEKFVNLICDKLKAARFKLWRDKRELKGGQVWINKLNKGIIQSKAAIIFIGEKDPIKWHGAESDILIKEGIEKNKLVIPVFLPGKRKTQTRNRFLARLQVIQFAEKNDTNAISNLINALKEKIRPKKYNNLSKSIINKEKVQIKRIKNIFKANSINNITYEKCQYNGNATKVCTLKRPSLTIAAELIRTNDTTNENMLILNMLNKMLSFSKILGNLSHNADKNDNKIDKQIIDNIGFLKAQIIEFYKIISDFKPNKDDMKEDERVKKILANRCKDELSPKEFVLKVNGFLKHTKNNIAYYSNPFHKIVSELANSLESIINLFVKSQGGGYKHNCDELPRLFQDIDDLNSSKLGIRIDELWSNLAHNCKKSPVMWPRVQVI